jgi:hypothetical protein
MRLDSETLYPVIIGMAIYLAAAKMSPEVRQSTGIKPIDDLIAMMIANQGSHMVGVLFTGLIILISNKVADRF